MSPKDLGTPPLNRPSYILSRILFGDQGNSEIILYDHKYDFVISYIMSPVVLYILAISITPVNPLISDRVDSCIPPYSF